MNKSCKSEKKTSAKKVRCKRDTYVGYYTFWRQNSNNSREFKMNNHEAELLHKWRITYLNGDYTFGCASENLEKNDFEMPEEDHFVEFNDSPMTMKEVNRYFSDLCSAKEIWNELFDVEQDCYINGIKRGFRQVCYTDIYGNQREGGFVNFLKNIKEINEEFEKNIWDTNTFIGKLEFNKRLIADGIEFDEDNNMILQ